MGRRGKPSTWLPRQKLAEERILMPRIISRSSGIDPEQFLAEFKIFEKFMFLSKNFRSPCLTRRPNFYPVYFQPNELRLCIHLKIKGLPSGLSTRIKTNLQIFQKIQKTRPIVCKIAMPFSTAYSLVEYYLTDVKRRGKPPTWLPHRILPAALMLPIAILAFNNFE